MIGVDTAACRDCDPELFDPGRNDHRAIELARKACARCETRLDCLALALANPNAQGIWGGLTQTERSAHRQRQLPQGFHAAYG